MARRHRHRPDAFRCGTEYGNWVMMEGGVSMETEHQERPHNKGTRFFTILFVLVIVLVILGAVTLFQRRSQYQALAKETETLAIPTVAIFHPTTESSEEELVLPGTMQAYVESPIYARTNGYLKKWYHDIGSRVTRVTCLRTSTRRKWISNFRKRAPI